MTDTPGWASPGSSEPSRDGARPPADAPAAVPGPSAPPQTTPQAPVRGSQYGPARPGGRGPSAWSAPRGPRPGVIPLRPLGIGELLDGAVTTVRRYWRTVLTLSLGFAVLQQAGVVAVELALAKGKTGDNTQFTTTFATLPLTLLLGALAAALLTVVVSRAVLGRPVTAGEAWREARPRLLQLLGLTTLTALLSAGVMLLGFTPWYLYDRGGSVSFGTAALLFLVGLMTLPVGFWLWIRFSLAAPALMLEKQGVLTALSRSRRLVGGAWWRVLGISMVARLFALVATMVIAMPFRILGFLLGFADLNRQASFDGTLNESTAMLITDAVAGLLASTLTIPFLAVVGVLVYIDQRIRREALDIELARAAALPEQDAAPADRPAPAGR
ncbi:hypothetical protein [Streptomyces sp. Y1]|uniref:Glycerophosphoryl diester phosphodiesterase membrane domain-containing protein n=1 Tax=Streptomyces sp. Y1 TaxID=3238634 RepID=A0AB39TN55_9ACTN